MNKTFLTLICAGLFTLGTSVTASAQAAKTNATPATPPVPAATASTNTAPRRIPFVGTVSSIDKTNKTITLEGPKKQVIRITATTKISKDKRPATFDAITVGIKVSGTRVQKEGGVLEAVTLNVRTDAAPKAAAPKAEVKVTPDTKKAE
jgi:hypothetical protein